MLWWSIQPEVLGEPSQIILILLILHKLNLWSVPWLFVLFNMTAVLTLLQVAMHRIEIDSLCHLLLIMQNFLRCVALVIPGWQRLDLWVFPLVLVRSCYWENWNWFLRTTFLLIYMREDWIGLGVFILPWLAFLVRNYSKCLNWCARGQLALLRFREYLLLQLHHILNALSKPCLSVLNSLLHLLLISVWLRPVIIYVFFVSLPIGFG